MNAYLLLGKLDDYHGEAVNPKHLSTWEIVVSGLHENYNPELDAQMKDGWLLGCGVRAQMGQRVGGVFFKVDMPALVHPPVHIRMCAVLCM